MTKNKNEKKTYNFQLIEEKIIQFWKKHKFKNPKTKKTFSILMPPPNVTGNLHLGHALNNFLQDTLIRFYKLHGYKTLWVPGFDHAGIATEIMVQKWIKKNQWSIQNNQQLQKYFQKWVQIQKKRITEQWTRMGLMTDQKWTNFTLNSNVKNAVKKAFINLYEEGLIYQAQKLINFDLKLQTVISDLEIVHKKQIGKMYYVKYFTKNKKKFIIVATTRPETIFADQALLIHPNDLKHQEWINKKVLNPLTKKIIPILKSEKVDYKLGSGVLKCTPGHDFIDFVIGQELQLKTVNCFDKKGILNHLSQEFVGLDRLQAKPQIIKKLQEENCIDKIIDIQHTLPYSARTDTLIEPMLSKQWFLKMKDWAKQLLQKKEQVNFLPLKYQSEFINWLHKCQDWCISRQLKWGHPMPIYFNSHGEFKISPTKPAGQDWKKTNDVLDTWFSSALWSLVNFGWNNSETAELKKYLPINYLITSYDIIFFWVTKMLFLHNHFTAQIPFQKILIHGLVRDQNNQKMSKSKGNSINPIDLINKFGVDSLRLYLLGDHHIGEDFKFNNDKLIQTNQFCNKLWNINHFVNLHRESIVDFKPQNCQNELNYYICLKLNDLIKLTKDNFQKHLWSLIIQKATQFIWKEFSNFYLKVAKEQLKNPKDNLETKKTINFVWTKILILMHPFVPFLTEFFWQEKENHDSILENDFVQPIKLNKNKKLPIIKEFFKIIEKTQNYSKNVKEKEIDLLIKTNKMQFYKKNLINLNQFLKMHKIKIIKIEEAKIEQISIFKKTTNEISNFSNFDEEMQFLKKELERSNKILNNDNFLKKAEPELVKKEKAKKEKWLKQIKNLINKGKAKV